MRSIYLWLGHHLASQGSLASADDVFFLTRDELGGLRHGEADPGDLRRRAARRKQDFHRLRAEFEVAPQTSYPDLLRGNRPVVVQPDMESAQLQGRGVSPGLGQGRAVIAHTPEDLQRLVHGDVLVAPGVDPGWTPAFSLLSGLVTEHGGQLSHAAVVAREYRLPAVVGVARATAVLHEGERLLVDGLAGTVLRLDLSPETSGFSISTSHGSTALET
jgi:phosphohistidine swiveling domain-containing protein